MRSIPRKVKWVIIAVLLVAGAGIGVVLMKHSGGESIQRNLPQTPPAVERSKSTGDLSARRDSMIGGEDRIGGGNLTADQQRKIAAVLKNRDEKLKAIWSNTTLTLEEQRKYVESLNNDCEARIREIVGRGK